MTPDPSTVAIIEATESAVLACLVAARDDYYGFSFLSFAHIAEETRLDKRQVREACRSLTRKGLAQYGRGLWTEDGRMAGSGYAATRRPA